MIEHFDRLLAQLSDATRWHGLDNIPQPWQQHEHAYCDQPSEAAWCRELIRGGQLAASRARQGHHRQWNAKECMCGKRTTNENDNAKNSVKALTGSRDTK
jgi:hypothetical protein